MTEGKYYIAVQAVDAGNMGGEWSDELVYEHQQVAVPVIMPIPSTYCTADTIALRVQMVGKMLHIHGIYHMVRSFLHQTTMTTLMSF